MTQNTINEGDQGIDRKNDVFTGINALRYAFGGSVGLYIPDAKRIVAETESLICGFKGRRILDVGCGHGISTLAIVTRCPKEIIAIDSSPDMIDLLNKTFLGNLELRNHFEYARDTLGNLFEDIITHLNFMRWEYRNSLFCKLGRKIETQVGSLTAIDHTGSLADAIIGCNSIHWPINAKRIELEQAGINGELALQRACAESLKNLSLVLKPGGVAGFVTSDDFVWNDENQHLETLTSENSVTEHPGFKKTHEIVAQVLENYGLAHTIPKRNKIIKKSHIKDLFSVHGFALHHVSFVSHAIPLDPRMFTFGLPMLLGKCDLPFQAKIEIIKRVQEKSKDIFENSANAALLRPFTHNAYSIILVKESGAA